MLRFFDLPIALPDSLSWAGGPLTSFVVTWLGWLVITLIVYYASRFVVRWVTRNSRTQIDDIIIGIIRWPLIILLISYGLLHSWEMAFGESSITNTLQRLHNGLLILLGAYVAWRILYEVVIAYLKPIVRESDSQADDIIIPILGRVGPVIIIVATANAVVATFGGDLGALLTGLGLLGLVLTYLFQEPLQGLFSGTYIALDNPFREDDLLILDEGKMCQVRNVGVRVTQLYDVKQHVMMFVPNSKLANATIVNVTRPNVELRTVLTVTMENPRDPKTAIALITEACDAHENILGHWPQKEAAIRRRQTAYRDELAALLALPSPAPSDEARIAWLQHHVERLDGELIRLQIEHTLRQTGERFSQALLDLMRFVSQIEDRGFTAAERKRIEQRTLALMDQFDELIEQITVWLYLLKVIQHELTEVGCNACANCFVERQSLRDGHLTLQELAECKVEDAPARRMVLRDELNRIRSSKIETDKVIRRKQFADRADYLDYRRLYTLWHRNIVKVYRGLEQIYHLESVEGEQERRLDERIQMLERHFSENFLLRVGRWQRPSANLVDANGAELKFELEVFIDDVVREQFQRSERVTTELLIEVDRVRSVHCATLNKTAAAVSDS